jgi:starch-binding outer membrane protein SusE/F
MNTIKTYVAALAVLFAATACEKEGDKLILSGHEASELVATETNVVLSPDNKSSLVLSLVWNSSTLTVSDASVGIPAGFPVNTLQASASADFATVIETQKTVTSQAYTGADLNTLAKNLGLTPDVAAPLYFRIQSKLGANLDPLYSNTVSVSVKPYFIDMSMLYLLDKAKAVTLSTLYSPTSNGEYAGFMAATSWMNFYFREGDGTVWGNDGVSGTPFVLSNDASSMWNGWFPGNNGCYYVTMSTANKAWTATLLPKIAVGGDATAELDFSTSLKLWSGVVTTSANNAKITLSSAAKRYTVSTGTNDDAAIATNIYFAESQSGVLTLADAAGQINVPTAGTYTLKIDLTNPGQWTYTLTPGEDVPVEEDIPYLYLAGIDDAVTGPGWNFNVSIPRIESGKYAGVAFANSLWGFRMHTTAEWADYYTQGATEGTLVKKRKRQHRHTR